MSVTLLDFQAQAAAQLSEAADEWVNAYAHNGVQYIGRTPIPFLGHLKAVTGPGKTPILTKVVGDLQNAVVLWTSVSSAVVDQTYRNLRGRYRSLLPSNAQILRERPSKGEWESLLESTTGITIWVTTVGSWNEAEAAEAGGKESARLEHASPTEGLGWRQITVGSTQRELAAARLGRLRRESQPDPGAARSAQRTETRGLPSRVGHSTLKRSLRSVREHH